MKVSSKEPHVNECLEGCPVYLCLDGENKELVGSVQNVRVEGTRLRASLVMTKEIDFETKQGRT